MIRLEWLFIVQLVMVVVMIVFLQKLIQMKKQVDEVTKEVLNYISFVTEDVEKEEDAEVQDRLIQAVLGEYFQ